MKEKDVFAPPIIYKNNFYTLEHTTSFNIPGYLILFFNKNKPFHEQSPEILSSLGHILALAIFCIKEVIQTNYVYCLSFGEGLKIPHFHLFPRTDQIKAEYQLINPSSIQGNISGPDLFAWIMKSKNGKYSNVELISNRITDKFLEQKNNYLKE
ncbi:hypothetical protein [Rickettsiella endosymbiont of Rhagonycha lignosa]|uniref:hypothetical protein n=1 Tax=Rickettsiella endosymbiont of Rhagonycha lignosa TaxID=3077937 RepID=UPI00313B061D